MNQEALKMSSTTQKPKKTSKKKPLIEQEVATKEYSSSSSEPLDEEEVENGRERLKRHRNDVAGHVWIPEMWGQEELLKDWIDCAAFDESLVPNGIVSARAALVQEGRRSNSGGIRIEHTC